ncbi:MAG: hypothetical protein ACYC59_00695 [Anaerolineaceae bacterium]
MKNKKKIDSVQIVSGMVVFISFLCLIFTSREGPLIEKTYQFPDSFVYSELGSTWGDAISSALKKYQINVRYPAQPWYGETFLIQVALANREGSTNSSLDASGIPPFILDVNLDLESMEAKPAKRLLLPIQLPQTGFVQWEITTIFSEMEQGKIWISLLPTTGTEPSIPVLVLPVDIEMRAILGLKIGMWRGIWTAIGIAGIGMFIFRGVKKNRDI